MTSARPEEPGLADAVRAGANWLYSLRAACDLIIGAFWLHRDDFARFVTTAAPVTGGATELCPHRLAVRHRQPRCRASPPAAAGRTRSCGWQPASPPGSPSTSTTPSADSTRASISLVVRAVRHAQRAASRRSRQLLTT